MEIGEFRSIFKRLLGWTILILVLLFIEAVGVEVIKYITMVVIIFSGITYIISVREFAPISTVIIVHVSVVINAVLICLPFTGVWHDIILYYYIITYSISAFMLIVLVFGRHGRLYGYTYSTVTKDWIIDDHTEFFTYSIDFGNIIKKEYRCNN